MAAFQREEGLEMVYSSMQGQYANNLGNLNVWKLSRVSGLSILWISLFTYATHTWTAVPHLLTLVAAVAVAHRSDR